MKVIKSKLVIFLCIPGILISLWPTSNPVKTLRGVCARVLDGDTIEVAGRRIRLANIDAPESGQYSYDRKPIGKLSTLFLRNLILNKQVTVQYLNHGRYGRILGTVYLNKMDINLRMIQAGMALTFGDKTPPRYRSSTYTAQITRRGLFRTEGFSRPGFFRKKKATH